MADHDLCDLNRDVTWIVLRNEDLGKLLASLTPAGLENLRADIERAHSVPCTISESGVRDGAWPDVPRFEISFRVPHGHIVRAVEGLKDAIKRQLAYKIRQHAMSK